MLEQLDVFKQHEAELPKYYYVEWWRRKYHAGKDINGHWEKGYHEEKWTKRKTKARYTYKEAVQFKHFLDEHVRYTAKSKIRKYILINK